MARLRGNTSIRRIGSKRSTDWLIAFTSSAYIAVPANSSVLLGSIASAVLLDTTPFTVIRTRGIVSFSSDQIAANEEQLGGVGLAFTTERARAAGIASLPVPVTSINDDSFFWLQFHGGNFRISSAVGVNPDMATNYEIDSKAMRKVESNDALVLVAENNHATNGFQVAVFIRILIKAG